MSKCTIPTDLMQLAANAYNEPHEIPASFTTRFTNRTWERIWGPFEKKGDLGTIQNLMYTAQLVNSKTYAIVLRGTSPDSLRAWHEDFDVRTQCPWNKIVKGACDEAKIAAGTLQGIKVLLTLHGKGGGCAGFDSAMLEDEETEIFICGHSLGGTLTPVYADYFRSANPLSPSPFLATVQPCSFAGLAPGNQAFADYIDGKFNDSCGGKWRFHNNYDAAPNIFWQPLSEFEKIYREAPAPILSVDEVERLAFEELYKGLPPYQQPNGDGYVLKGTKQQTSSWIEEAEMQHNHLNSYVPLVAVAMAGECTCEPDESGGLAPSRASS